MPGVPNYFSDFDVDFSGTVFGHGMSAYLDTAPYMPNNYDMIIGNSGEAFLMPANTSPTKLFELEFMVSWDAVFGTYGLAFIPDATSAGYPINFISGVGTSGVELRMLTDPSYGHFAITAVPEPSKFFSSFLLFNWYIFRRKSRRRRRMPAPKLSSIEATNLESTVVTTNLVM